MRTSLILFALVLLALGLAALGLHARAAAVVLRLHGARRLHFEDAPRVHALVARLSRAARMAVPRLYVIHRSRPNAFSIGTHRREAGIILTAGALRELDEGSLAALIAHELAHIAQGHTRRATLAAAVTAVLVRAAGGLRRVASRVRPPRAGGLESAALHPALGYLHRLGTPSRHDLSADRFAAELVGGTQGLIALLARLETQQETAGADLGSPFTDGCAGGTAIDARLRALRRLAEEERARRQSGIWLPRSRRGSRFAARPRDARPRGRRRMALQDGLPGR